MPTDRYLIGIHEVLQFSKKRQQVLGIFVVEEETADEAVERGQVRCDGGMLPTRRR
jgi:hypothetical protein